MSQDQVALAADVGQRVGLYVRRARLASGHDLEAFARRVSDQLLSGGSWPVNAAMVADWEVGAREPQGSQLLAMAAAVGLDWEQLARPPMPWEQLPPPRPWKADPGVDAAQVDRWERGDDEIPGTVLLAALSVSSKACT
jgi:hypothetical protein